MSEVKEFTFRAGDVVDARIYDDATRRELTVRATVQATADPGLMYIRRHDMPARIMLVGIGQLELIERGILPPALTMAQHKKAKEAKANADSIVVKRTDGISVLALCTLCGEEHVVDNSVSALMGLCTDHRCRVIV